MNKENGTWFVVMIHYKDVDSDFHAKIGTLDMDHEDEDEMFYYYDGSEEDFLKEFSKDNSHDFWYATKAVDLE